MEQRTPQKTKKKLWQILGLGLLTLLVTVVGFALGRGTGEDQEKTIGTSPIEKVWSVLPPIPKDAGEPTQPEDKPLIVESPAENGTVARTFTVTGRARKEQATITATVTSDKGVVLASAQTTLAQIVEGQQFGRFSLSLAVGDYQGKATIQVVGSTPEAQVTRQITIADPDTITINVFFGKKNTNGNVDCEQVFPVSRVISGKSVVYRDSIEELIKGTTPSEEALGYFTSLPNKVRIKSIASDANGKVTVEFDESLERGVAGSCRVLAIRSQITATLKQFPEVREVVIMVNGRIDGVLQP